MTNYKIKLEYACLLFVWGIMFLLSCVSHMQSDGLPFSDTDDYMRLVYVLEYMKGNLNWYDHIISRSNVPFGCDIHWTHLYDLILMAGANVFKPFCSSLKDALFNWSVIVTPVISSISIITFYKICRNFFSKELSVLAGIFFMLHPLIYAQIRSFRPDHHGFLILLAIVMVKWLIDFIKVANTEKYKLSAFKLGLSYSLAITASPELLIVLLPIELFFVFYWCGFQINTRAIAVKSWYWLLTMIICYVIFSSDGYHAIQNIDYDKISIVHVALALASTVFWSIILCVQQFRSPLTFALNNAGNEPNVATIRTKSDIKHALYVAIGVGLPIIAVIFCAFPNIIYLMSGKVSPELKELWLNNVSEMRSPLRDFASCFFWRTIALFAVTLYGGIVVCKKYMDELSLRHKFITIYALAVLFLYAIIGAMTYRVGYYFATFSIPLIIVSLFNIPRIPDRYKGHSALVLFITFLYIIPIGMFLAIGSEEYDKKTKVNQKALVEYLQTLRPSSTILATDAFGPTILFYTDHNVIVAPYHRQEYGLLAGCKVFSSKTAELDELAKIIKKSNVSYLVVHAKKDLSSICRKLTDGPLPSYLEKLDTGLRNVLIFKVISQNL